MNTPNPDGEFQTEDNLSDRAYAFSQAMRDEMLEKRGGKYRLFLMGMETSIQTAKLVFRGNHGKERGEFLRFFYAAMRYVDDVVDGDQPLPESFASTAEFVRSLLAILDAPEKKAANDVEALLLHCMELGKSFGQDFANEARIILQSLLFDAERRGGTSTFPEHDLQTYFFDCDIRGTVRACLKLYDEDPTLEEELIDLGNATRIHYNLRDFEEDIRAGLINISKEDMERLNITVEDLKTGTKHAGIHRWFVEQAALGLELLEKHEKKLPALNIKHRTTRMILHMAYERGAKNYLTRLLSSLGCNPTKESSAMIVQDPLRHTIAVAGALKLSARHMSELGIRMGEVSHFMKKSGNLALCYSGFSATDSQLRYSRAGQAAFFSAAYDVATDWHRFNPETHKTFSSLLTQHVSPEEQKIALDLYEKDKAGTLKNDGLERGSLALEFIVSVMDIRDEFERRGIDVTDAGEELQIVDDILDVEEDMHNQDTNCLLTTRRAHHLKRMIDSKLLEHFESASVLGRVIQKARLKAHILLRQTELQVKSKII